MISICCRCEQTALHRNFCISLVLSSKPNKDFPSNLKVRNSLAFQFRYYISIYRIWRHKLPLYLQFAQKDDDASSYHLPGAASEVFRPKTSSLLLLLLYAVCISSHAHFFTLCLQSDAYIRLVWLMFPGFLLRWNFKPDFPLSRLKVDSLKRRTVDKKPAENEIVRWTFLLAIPTILKQGNLNPSRFNVDQEAQSWKSIWIFFVAFHDNIRS